MLKASSVRGRPRTNVAANLKTCEIQTNQKAPAGLVDNALRNVAEWIFAELIAEGTTK